MPGELHRGSQPIQEGAAVRSWICSRKLSAEENMRGSTLLVFRDLAQCPLIRYRTRLCTVHYRHLRCLSFPDLAAVSAEPHCFAR